MAELSLLFQPTLTTIDTLTIDATVSEQHTSEVEVTEHPVEEGSEIADHKRVKPLTVTIEGLITNTPINRSQARRIVESFGTTIQTTSLEDELAGQPGYAEQAFTLLEQLRDGSKLIQVVTPLKTYNDMVLTALSVPRTSANGDSLRFTATFKQVRLVRNQTATVQVAKIPQGNKKVSTGKQAAAQASDAEAKKKSWAKSLSDNTGLSGLLGLP